jgi:acetyl-CoA acetyltransferase
LSLNINSARTAYAQSMVLVAPLLSNQAHLGALIADFAGLNGIEALTLEAAGASGGVALRVGYMAVASGQADVALVLGVEKISDQVGTPVEAALATSSDSDYEARAWHDAYRPGGFFDAPLPARVLCAA